MINIKLTKVGLSFISIVDLILKEQKDFSAFSTYFVTLLDSVFDQEKKRVLVNMS